MTPLLQLRGVQRAFPGADGPVTVLHGIDLTIEAGEMVAIIGPSGSGKSTLMNILGCLDAATAGSYQVRGHETRELGPDALAALRREHFGFVFQRYQLLAGMTAEENVALPALYAGTPARERRTRARSLLSRLGLGERLTYRPSQLSGGQQQRVSIARALMNGGSIILADEPTGALDSASGAQVMALLKELHASGHTIILVTHDSGVAAHAQRVVELADGHVVADRKSATFAAGVASAADPLQTPRSAEAGGWRDRWGPWREAISTAVHALGAHKLRSALTMLGIVIGIVSVILVNAIGAGASQRIISEFSRLGTTTVHFYPGPPWGDPTAAVPRPLTPEDAHALIDLPGVAAVSPRVDANATARAGNRSQSARIEGVGEGHFAANGIALVEGSGFNSDAVERLALDAVIDERTRRALFPDVPNPVGQLLMLGRTPARVIGVGQAPPSGMPGLTIWLPYTTVASRINGRPDLSGIVVQVADKAQPDDVQHEVLALLEQRHGQRDVQSFNLDAIRKSMTKTTQTLSNFVSSIAIVALVVGGIGVMNIMLVTVSERTREIGIRMAVGARQHDILRQFLVEAVVVCMIGAALGIALALIIGNVVSATSRQYALVFTGTSIALAVACASFIGIAFGYFPARGAAKLNPAQALARD